MIKTENKRSRRNLFSDIFIILQKCTMYYVAISISISEDRLHGKTRFNLRVASVPTTKNNRTAAGIERGTKRMRGWAH